MLCSSAFLAIPPLPSIDSATSKPVLFADFIGTTSECDFSSSYIIGFGSSPSRCGPSAHTATGGQAGELPGPVQRVSVHARFYDHAAGRPHACNGARRRTAFRYTDRVGTRNKFSFAAPWLACTYPCRRFADILTDVCARLGADVVRYSFIAGDLHPLLLAGLPAHLCENVMLFLFGGSPLTLPTLKIIEYSAF